MNEMQKKLITKLCISFSDLKLLYFFGSRAQNDYKPTSDYDFAGYFDRKTKKPNEDYLTFIARLSQCIESDNIDVFPLGSFDKPLLFSQRVPMFFSSVV